MVYTEQIVVPKDAAESVSSIYVPLAQIKAV